jgi:predicted enzyme related to lactoylglutathione lyase
MPVQVPDPRAGRPGGVARGFGGRPSARPVDVAARSASEAVWAASVHAVHRSRLYGLFVDAPVAEAARAVDFWSAALGVKAVHGEDDDPYTALPDAINGLVMEVQAVDDAPRHHVDIETDDVAAEVRRLTALGATEVAKREGWFVLRAPGGHLLCVVPVQSDPERFAANARTWDA